jgi:hypothetical protein
MCRAVDRQDHPAPAHPHPATYPKQGVNGKAVTAFILTLIGFLFLPVVFSSAGIVLALLARGEFRRHPGLEGRGLATAALVIGPLGFVFSLVVAMLVNA